MNNIEATLIVGHWYSNITWNRNNSGHIGNRGVKHEPYQYHGCNGRVHLFARLANDEDKAAKKAVWNKVHERYERRLSVKVGYLVSARYRGTYKGLD